ncbi:type II toxin-antitoxin system RelE/ParE family toxin [Calothrix sp. FACHB-1219]|uniref:type II toxin-antitoxin system RelE/ParE family toxin n=1 Tax=unclassified Calothrix TaxID=2619626 RepID=UPI001682FB73|nr:MULTISPECIES: type II toxin-antitoxin system RelE/ParE family toxin [unclassified Calothrix]MBD2203350.1 type II toxin-antitoxin system RelE/ParE family toxin [Calothrix sp. FACHB-168]MBD2216353.1 type II toxin-antitoxin system RelE/ParE family toxin [Calothrix sp. FACHB-1219]
MSIYIISPEAIQDLDEISEYFASRNLDAGDRFVNSFAEKCQNLVKYPNMGRSYADIETSLRGIPLDGYIILYRAIADGVEIVRVVSGYRNLKSMFSESDDE